MEITKICYTFVLSKLKNMKTTITPIELKNLIMNIFDEEITTYFGYTVEGYEDSFLEGKEPFESKLIELLNGFEISVKQPKLDKLPENWVVKNDGSKLFKDTVCKWLNEKYNIDYYGNSINCYYGVYEDVAVSLFSKVENTELSIQQFIELTK